MSLSEETKLEIRRYILGGLAIFGTINVVAIVTGYAYIAFVLPKEITTEAIESVRIDLIDDLSILRTQIAEVSGNALIEGGRALEKADTASKQIDKVKERLKSFQLSLNQFSDNEQATANVLKAAEALKNNPDIVSRVNNNEIKLNTIETKSLAELQLRPKILGVVRVESGKIVSRTKGVTFEPSTGIVSFPNPKNMDFVPVVSDFSANAYITETHFIRAVISKKAFKVWRTPLDTGGRNSPPNNFTAIIVAF